MNIRSFRLMPVTVSVITTLATGCGTVSSTASSPAQPDPELADITVAALPAADLPACISRRTRSCLPNRGCT